jgi:hypothetical protein
MPESHSPDRDQSHAAAPWPVPAFPGWNLAKLLILIWILARGAIRNNHAQTPHDIQYKKGGAA